MPQLLSCHDLLPHGTSHLHPLKKSTPRYNLWNGIFVYGISYIYIFIPCMRKFRLRAPDKMSEERLMLFCFSCLFANRTNLYNSTQASLIRFLNLKTF